MKDNFIGGAEFTLGESTCMICKNKPKFKTHKEWTEHLEKAHGLKTRFGIDKSQDKENEAYLKLRKIGYKVEMSEAYVPIHMRRYEVWTNRECIFKGDFNEFIKFTEEQDDKIDS